MKFLRKIRDAYLGTSLGPHTVRSETDGSIIRRAVVARSGYQDYKLSEIEPASGSDEIVSVYRPADEVLSPAFLASLEGAVLTSDHPSKFVDPSNYSWVSRGFVVNASRGPDDAEGNVTVEADLHCKDQSIIDQIENGKRQVSCGYLYELENEGGRLTMRNLKANHVAVVERARAGTVAQITDSAPAEPYEIDEPQQDDKGESFEKMISRFHRQDPARVAKDADRLGLHSDNEESPIFKGSNTEGGGDTKAEDDLITAATTGAKFGEKLASGKVIGDEMECNCEAEKGGAHLKSCPMFGKDKCVCDAGDEAEAPDHHKSCPMFKAAAEDNDNDGEQFRESTPTRARGAGPELIPVPGGGNEGNTNPVARDAYVVNIQALENLRALKPAIVAHARKTGDNSGVEFLNRCVVGLKREIGRYESQVSARPSTQRVQRSAQDDAKARQEQIASDFEATVKAARAAAMADTFGFRTGGGSRVAVDAATSRPKDDVSFQDQVAVARRAALGK